MAGAAQQQIVGRDPKILKAITLDESSPAPLYSQVADFLGGLVDREFNDEDLFFTEKVLVEHLPVSQVTIRRAMQELAALGMVQRTRRRGTTITKRRRLTSIPFVSLDSNSVRGPATERSPEFAAKKIRTIGIFRPAHAAALSEHASSLMEEFRLQCVDRDLACRFYDTTDADAVLRSFQEITSDPQEEAFVLHTSVNATDMLSHSLANRGFRSVAIEGVPLTFSGWVVETDAAEAARIAVRHLTGLGHTHIALLVNEPAIEPTVIDKIEAFKEVTASLAIGGYCRTVFCGTKEEDSYEVAYSHVAEAVEKGAGGQATAIFTVSDPGGWAVLKWCSQNGLRVPEDISVVGFEDAKSSKYMIPALTSIAHPRQLVVSTALNVLCGATSGPPRNILVPPVLIVRESSGKVPRAAAAHLSKVRKSQAE